MNLYNVFGDLKKSYYDIGINVDRLFENVDNSRSFIVEHFIKGRKQNALNLSFTEEYERFGKHFHTVALYLLGLYFQDMFYLYIKNDLFHKIPDMQKWYSEEEYKYSWFLTCLYHDTASCIERKGCSCCNNCIKQYRFPSNNFLRFSKETIKNYCRYRKDDGMQDHGIFGGFMLYDKLYKNFKRVTKGHNWEEKPVFNKYGVTWRKEHPDHFGYIADAIICHNLWTVQANDENGVAKYQSYGLDNLIINGDQDKLTLNQYPLQFMLCLLDSIEPVKRFEGQLEAKEVLKNVSIEYSIENNQIRIGWTDVVKTKPGFFDWQKNIVTLSDWMNVDVTPCNCERGECYVTINIR